VEAPPTPAKRPARTAYLRRRNGEQAPSCRLAGAAVRLKSHGHRRRRCRRIDEAHRFQNRSTPTDVMDPILLSPSALPLAQRPILVCIAAIFSFAAHPRKISNIWSHLDRRAEWLVLAACCGGGRSHCRRRAAQPLLTAALRRRDREFWVQRTMVNLSDSGFLIETKRTV
jgi:hypothetical protein